MSAASSRRRSLGKVTSVTADRFVVELSADSDSFTLVGFDGQHYVARIGSFVLIPLQAEHVVAEIVGLRDTDLGSRNSVETEIQDSLALVSIKYLDVVPIGTLPFREDECFRFGVSVFPALYSDALYAQSADLDRILDVSESTPVGHAVNDSTVPTATTAFTVGTSVVFDDYSVKVRVDEFFGGHSAILGNTGSGKSCTVAAIVQSIFTKPEEHHARGASFLVFDTNGEYRQAFAELPSPIRRRYALVPERESSDCPAAGHNERTLSFRLPHWYLSFDEWELLLQASEKTQRPILRTALGLTSMFGNNDEQLRKLKNHVLASSCLAILQLSESVPASAERIRSLVTVFFTPDLNMASLSPLVSNAYGAFTGQGNTRGELLHSRLESLLQSDVIIPEYRNSAFEFRRLGEALELAILYEESHGNRHIRDYCSSLLTRFKSVRDRSEFAFMRPALDSLKTHESTADGFVNLLLGLSHDGSTKKSQLTILDMNEVDDEIVEVVSAVVTRLIFERLRRLDDRNTMPVNLILEEAHRYISDKPRISGLNAATIFERVAKEGRKYGLFILLASQRPSELSRTVLSQCSNFIVHRIQNPEDLTHIRQMTPFISDAVLSRLPSLPKQHALIFGNSVNVPTTFRVRDADPTPKSDDARISRLWFVPRIGS